MTPRRWLPGGGEAPAIAASAGLFALAFPPAPFAIPALLCLAPMAVTLARHADAGRPAADALRSGAWMGALGYGVSLYWIASALSSYTPLAVLAYLACLALLASLTALVFGALSVLRRATALPMTLLLPVVWVAGEVALAHLPDVAFPWLPLGLASARSPRLAQLADISGVHGVSFWAATINGALADAWLLRGRVRSLANSAAIVTALLAGATAYGDWRLRSVETRPVARIAVVQPDLRGDGPRSHEWGIGVLAAQTRRLAGEERAPSLIVWPEAALPGYLAEHPEWGDTLRALATATGAPILFGVLDAERRARAGLATFNAAMLTDGEGRVDAHAVYRKAHLVPVVERVPFVDPTWFAGMRYAGGFSPGGDPPIYRLPFGAVGVMICYESIFPGRARLQRRRGVEVLVNLTNDSWSGRSIAPYQHEAHTRLRAIENRIAVVRAATTGISEYVDPLGRVHGATALFTRATPVYEVRTADERSPYVRFGDWVGAASMLGTLGLLGATGARRRRAPARRA